MDEEKETEAYREGYRTAIADALGVIDSTAFTVQRAAFRSDAVVRRFPKLGGLRAAHELSALFGVVLADGYVAIATKIAELDDDAK